jgi:hypothetical protein
MKTKDGFVQGYNAQATEGGAARLPSFLWPSASRFFSAFASRFALCLAAALASASSSALADLLGEQRLPTIDAVDPLDLFQIDLLDHQVQDEPRQVILVDELLNRRRQQHRLIDLPGAIALAYEQAQSIRRHSASKIRDFSDKLLACVQFRSLKRRACRRPAPESRPSPDAAPDRARARQSGLRS